MIGILMLEEQCETFIQPGIPVLIVGYHRIPPVMHDLVNGQGKHRVAFGNSFVTGRCPRIIASIGYSVPPLPPCTREYWG